MAASRKCRRVDSGASALEAEVTRVVVVDAGSPTRVTVALSGGRDSIVLAEVLRRIAKRARFELDAVHIHHGLSPNADLWESFARRYCARRSIPFRSIRVQVDRARGIEAGARDARYAVLGAHPSDMVALAHHADDQAETVLLQLLRGAGARGLSAMPVVRPAAGLDRATAPRFVRPLLRVERSRIEAYARARRLRWIEDESNADDAYARNFLRKRVLPLLERRFPGSRQALARSARHLAESAALLDVLAQLDAVGAGDADRLRVSALAELGQARARNLLRHFLSTRGVAAPSAVRLDEALRQLVSAGRGTSPSVDVGDVALRRHRGWLEIVQRNAAVAETGPVEWSIAPVCVLPDLRGRILARAVRGRGVSRARLEGGALSIRRRMGGERIRLDTDRPRRTLKNLLQEHGVPPWVRDRMPLLFRGEELVWVPGIGIEARYRAAAREAGIELEWQPAPLPAGDPGS